MSGALSPYAGMSVLIVDDNPSNVALLRALLAEQGLYRIYTETDARKVSERLTETDPDLVLLDVHMPHLDGYEILSQIQRFAAGAYLPVLVLTADTTTTARDRALGNGAQDFLTKPLDAVETTLRVANLLQTRQLHARLRLTAQRSERVPPQVARDRPATHRRIRGVLRDKTITPVFQRIVDVDSLITVGYEALSRFPDITRGGPDRWFADAFNVGLGVELEWLAANTALSFLDGAPPDTFLAINMSPATILRLLEEELCPPKLCPRIVIELTEHVPIADYSALHRALAGMRSRGTRMAADDLGSGYAGFRHLVSLQPDIIKLDISLVRGIHLSRGQRALSRALVAFAGDVDAIVIAEGVEESAELAVLRDIGVPWAQGFYLGRPEAAAAATAGEISQQVRQHEALVSGGA